MAKRNALAAFGVEVVGMGDFNEGVIQASFLRAWGHPRYVSEEFKQYKRLRAVEQSVRSKRSHARGDFAHKLALLEPQEAKRAWAVAIGEIAEKVYATSSGPRSVAEEFRDKLGSAKNIIGNVYFIDNGTDASPVKIGWTLDIRKRLYIMQVGNPERLRLIGDMPGDQSIENALHGIFARDNIRGEWFKRSEPLDSFIHYASMRAPKYPNG